VPIYITIGHKGDELPKHYKIGHEYQVDSRL